VTATTPKRTPPPGAPQARRAGLFMLLSVLGLGVPLPWTAVVLVPLGAAGVELVRGLRAMGGGAAGARAIVWSSVGLLLTVLMAGSVVLPYLFYDLTRGYQECMLGANTTAAQAGCRAELYRGLGSVLGGWAPVSP
jgi:hypothetical protein